VRLNLKPSTGNELQVAHNKRFNGVIVVVVAKDVVERRGGCGMVVDGDEWMILRW
jgi:hypothetical protein